MLVADWQLLFALFMCNALFGDVELFVGNVGAADDDWKHFRQLPIVRCTVSPAGSLGVNSIYVFLLYISGCVCVCFKLTLVSN